MMFFIGFPIFPYPIRPPATKTIAYTQPYAKSIESISYQAKYRS